MKKKRRWIVSLVAIVIVSITLGFLVLLHYSSENNVKITRITKDFEFADTRADVWVDGWKEIHFFNFRYYVDIKNSNNSDVSNLKIVVDLKVNNDTVASNTGTIKTLKAGESKHILLLLNSVPHIHLFDESGNFKGTIVLVITLYYGGEVLDQVTTSAF